MKLSRASEFMECLLSLDLLSLGFPFAAWRGMGIESCLSYWQKTRLNSIQEESAKENIWTQNDKITWWGASLKSKIQAYEQVEVSFTRA